MESFPPASDAASGPHNGSCDPLRAARLEAELCGGLRPTAGPQWATRNPMRLLHTSDWHLGRSLFNLSLLEDHAAVLGQIVEIAREARPDAVLIAGDLYDRAVPPPDAVELLDDILSRLILDLELHVVVLAGNHDSRERLGFAARLLERNRLHIAAARSPVRIVPFEDRHGPVEILALSYLDPAEAREFLGPDDLRDHDAALRALIARARAGLGAPRSILAAHVFVEGGSASDSERPLTVGGAGAVSADCFDGFPFVALGHLHRPQSVGQERIHYSGAPLKFSFAEAGQQKSISLVELDARGDFELSRIPLLPRREMHCLEGFFDHLLRDPPPGVRREDLISITLLDEHPVLDAMNRLRERYPNLLQLSQPALVETQAAGVRPPDAARLSDDQLFADFFQQVTGRPLLEAERAELLAALEEFRRREEQDS